MYKREPVNLIEDILPGIEKIFVYTNTMTYEGFITDSMVIDAVVRNFEIIGEPVNRLPDDTKINILKLTGTKSEV